MKNNLLLTIIVAIVVGAAAFFGGVKYQENKTPQRDWQRQGGQFQNIGRNNLRPVNGEIISTDEESITVKLNDGSSKIVLLSEKTTMNKASEAAKTDLKKGEKVAVFGTENSDGSVTAQNIELNPVLRGMIQNSK